MSDEGHNRVHSANLHPHNVPTSEVEVDLAAQTHQGHVRDNNEDHYLAVRVTRSLENIVTNLSAEALPKSFDEIAYGMLVADGIGGTAAGEVASSAALLKLMELALETPDWMMTTNQPEAAPTIMRRMTQRFWKIDDELRAQGESDSSLRGMGTTLTAALSLGTEVFLAHLGDSRAYLLRGRKLHQLTKDHTLAQAMIDAGLAGPDDSATQAMRHVLTGALGTTAEPTDPQVQRLHLSDDDQLLLCTDGLTEMVSDEDIASILMNANSSASACQALIDQALAEGGRDNVTVVLARYHFPRVGLAN
jgi:serine/threonine protein phosphatase PrpC